ncbi:4469_t:CDS:2 [Entrophospora sp. SA101]|nr:4469_t:CDS:2 [Entrophospora sp. SA101]CAJ0896472.1 5198_t:CDS:2 [Entrophospora sp. SA101]
MSSSKSFYKHFNRNTRFFSTTPTKLTFSNNDFSNLPPSYQLTSLDDDLSNYPSLVVDKDFDLEDEVSDNGVVVNQEEKENYSPSSIFGEDLISSTSKKLKRRHDNINDGHDGTKSTFNFLQVSNVLDYYPISKAHPNAAFEILEYEADEMADIMKKYEPTNYKSKIQSKNTWWNPEGRSNFVFVRKVFNMDDRVQYNNTIYDDDSSDDNLTLTPDSVPDDENNTFRNVAWPFPSTTTTTTTPSTNHFNDNIFTIEQQKTIKIPFTIWEDPEEDNE